MGLSEPLFDMTEHQFKETLRKSGEGIPTKGADGMASRMAELDAAAAAAKRNGELQEAVCCLEESFVTKLQSYGAQADEVLTTCGELALSYNMLAMRMVEEAGFDEAYELLKKAEILTEPDGSLKNDFQKRLKLNAITLNNLGCFFKRKGKLQAALHYLNKAISIETQTKTAENPAGTLLNLCATLSQLGRHAQALKHAEKAIETLQNSKDSVGGAAAAKTSFLAIAYHNQAVEQEFLARRVDALNSYRQAVVLADKCWGCKSAMALALRNNMKAFQRQTKPGSEGSRPGHNARPASAAPRMLTSSETPLRKRPGTASGAVSTTSARQPPTYTLHSQRQIYEPKRRPKTAHIGNRSTTGPPQRALSAKILKSVPAAVARVYCPRAVPPSLQLPRQLGQLGPHQRPASSRTFSRSPTRISREQISSPRSPSYLNVKPQRPTSAPPQSYQLTTWVNGVPTNPFPTSSAAAAAAVPPCGDETFDAFSFEESAESYPALHSHDGTTYRPAVARDEDTETETSTREPVDLALLDTPSADSPVKSTTESTAFKSAPPANLDDWADSLFANYSFEPTPPPLDASTTEPSNNSIDASGNLNDLALETPKASPLEYDFLDPEPPVSRRLDSLPEETETENESWADLRLGETTRSETRSDFGSTEERNPKALEFGRPSRDWGSDEEEEEDMDAAPARNWGAPTSTANDVAWEDLGKEDEEKLYDEDGSIDYDNDAWDVDEEDACSPVGLQTASSGLGFSDSADSFPIQEEELEEIKSTPRDEYQPPQRATFNRPADKPMSARRPSDRAHRPSDKRLLSKRSSGFTGLPSTDE